MDLVEGADWKGWLTPDPQVPDLGHLMPTCIHQLWPPSSFSESSYTVGVYALSQAAIGPDRGAYRARHYF